MEPAESTVVDKVPVHVNVRVKEGCDAVGEAWVREGVGGIVGGEGVVQDGEVVIGEQLGGLVERCSGGSEEVDGGVVWELPGERFEGLWESLEFEDGVKTALLAYIESGCLFSTLGVDDGLIGWNRVVLLHGPPGTGKTSLSKALVQKLAIRLDAKEAVLVEVRADALFSKWFSESSRNVGALFEHVLGLAQRCDLVVVLLDEVESLTAARTGASGAVEPSDALRVVNALLTALDSLRSCKNCLVLATSNLTDRIDPAFLDRADIRQHIGLPTLRARYTILRSCVNELIARGVVAAESPLCVLTPAEPDEGPEALLLSAAKKADGMSGRALRKLPLLAHARFIGGAMVAVPLQRYLTALCSAAAVNSMQTGKMPCS